MDYEAIKNYKQRIKLKAIQEYNYFLKQELMNEVIKSHSLTPIDAPIIQRYANNVFHSFFSSNSRSVSFSSNTTDLFLELPIYFDLARRWLLYKHDQDEITGIIYDTPVVWRDTKLDNLTAIKMNQIEIEYILSKNDTRDTRGMIKIVDRFTTSLLKVVDKMYAKTNIGKVFLKMFPHCMHSDLIKKFGKRTVQQLLDLHSQDESPFIIIDDSRNNQGFSNDFHFLPTTHRIQSHAKLVAKFAELGRSWPLVEFAFSANYQDQLNQLQIVNYSGKNDYSLLLQKNLIKPSVAIKIYIPRLVVYLLELMHVAEVIKSEWPYDFLAFIGPHGTSIL